MGLRQLEFPELFLNDNAKIILTKDGITPNIIIGALSQQE